MGQKVNPHGMRVGIIKDWDSRWFAGKKNFGEQLVEDYNLRKTLKKQLYEADQTQNIFEDKTTPCISVSRFTQ